MNASRKLVVALTAVAVVVAGVVYSALPLLWQERAALACQLTIPEDGRYTTEWNPVPPAHWACTSVRDGGPSRVIDLGWWPTVPVSAAGGEWSLGESNP